ncbi:predicted protein [Arabidopsis lyrata subsp. lyrata]|uniref:Predicted protein n=1 Tax=Arabidopsis lyrata subsp. lyrata TaxID=81972 RepID=D7MW57_ARALL|nr:predicted protein [Arabidopsis lyrata subsp. lyrata]
MAATRGGPTLVERGAVAPDIPYNHEVQGSILHKCIFLHWVKLLAGSATGCNLLDSGKTYYCAKCDYHLHDHCASCPPTLHNYMHPQHELQLVFKGPEHYCDICTKSVQGLYYRCNACDFDAHAVCALLTEVIYCKKNII